MNTTTQTRKPAVSPRMRGETSAINYDARTIERRAGIQSAGVLLGPLYENPNIVAHDHPNASTTASQQLLELSQFAGRKHDYAQESHLKVVALTPHFIKAQGELDLAKAKARHERSTRGAASPATRDMISRLRHEVFHYNETLKEYLDTHPDESIFRTVGMLLASYRIMTTQEGETPVPTPDVEVTLIGVARGMRSELAAEQMLGEFTEDVEICYRYTDNAEVRRKLDSEGTDYIVTVTVLGKKFDLYVDIKASESDTLDNQRRTLPGKLWARCSDKDFTNDSSRMDFATIRQQALPMQDALIEQIQLQYPGELETLCEDQGIGLDDIYIN